MTGVQLLPEMAGLDEALGVVSSIGIVLLGSLPFAEILQHLLKKPLEWVGEKIGLGRLGTAGLLVGIVSALPVIADMKQMNEREIVMNAALLVCGTSMVAARICPGCGCSGDRSTSGWKTDRGHCRSLDGMADHEKD